MFNCLAIIMGPGLRSAGDLGIEEERINYNSREFINRCKKSDLR